MKKRNILILATLIIIAVISVIVAIQKQSKNGDGIKIGVLLPLTGDAAVYGKSLQTGVDLALREFNARGGIDNQKISLIYEDTQADPKTAVSAFRKLLTVDHPALVIGDMFSHTTLAIAPLAQKAGIVLLSPTASAQAIPKVGDNIFTIYPSDAYDGQFLAESMPTLLPAAKRYVIVYAQTEAMMTCKDAFVASLRSPGRIVLQEAIPADTRDLRPLLLNVRRASPDAVLIAAFLPETGLFLRLAREQDFRVAFIGISTSYDPKLFEVAGRATDGLLFSAPFFDPSQQDPGIRSFVSAYTSAYGMLPDVWAAYGYDVVLIALQAIGSDIRPLNRALLSMAPFDGVTGRTVFNKDGSVTKALRMLRADASTQSFKSASTNQ